MWSLFKIYIKLIYNIVFSMLFSMAYGRSVWLTIFLIYAEMRTTINDEFVTRRKPSSIEILQLCANNNCKLMLSGHLFLHLKFRKIQILTTSDWTITKYTLEFKPYVFLARFYISCQLQATVEVFQMKLYRIWMLSRILFRMLSVTYSEISRLLPYHNFLLYHVTFICPLMHLSILRI
jgi:hypothetical protein